MPSPCRRPSKIPLSTSVNRARCARGILQRTMSSPLHSARVLCERQRRRAGAPHPRPPTRSSFGASGLAASHRPSASHAGLAAFGGGELPLPHHSFNQGWRHPANVTGDPKHPRPHGHKRNNKASCHSAALYGVSGTGVSGGLPENQAFRLSTTHLPRVPRHPLVRNR